MFNQDQDKDQLPPDLVQTANIATGDTPSDGLDSVVSGGNEWPVNQTGALIANQFVTVFSVLASGWAISDDEKAMIEAPLAQIASAMLPEGAGANPYFCLVTASVMIAAPRIIAKQPFRLPPPEPQQQAAQPHLVSQPVQSGDDRPAYLQG